VFMGVTSCYNTAFRREKMRDAFRCGAAEWKRKEDICVRRKEASRHSKKTMPVCVAPHYNCLYLCTGRAGGILPVCWEEGLGGQVFCLGRERP